MTLDAGDKAPDFDLPTDGGGSLGLKDLAGKTVVLYFYPKDSTPGCTQEAKDFRDMTAELEAAGAMVVGVSKDSVASHDKFKAKQELPFSLISDGEGELCEAFGVWKEKKNYGRVYMGVERSTFLIDGAGVVRKAWRKVRVKGHAEEVLEAAKAL